MIKFRQYQWDAIKSIWEYFEAGNKGNPLIAMPTGTGKSLVIAGFVRTVLEQFNNQKILILTHVKELIVQNKSKLDIIWPTNPSGVYSSGLKKKELYRPIIFGGIGSVYRKPELFGKIDLIIIDEAHLVNPNKNTMYMKLITSLKEINPNLKIIGLTATPFRTKQGMLTDGDNLFTDICYDLTNYGAFNNLIKEGFIVPLIPKKTTFEYDLNGIPIIAGDYSEKALQINLDKDELTELAIKETLENSHNRNSWLIFTSGIEHTMHVHEVLRGHGINCGYVHSGNKQYKMKDSERDKTIEEFRNGDLQAVVNSNILTTGFDHASLDLISVLTATISPGKWVQMLGRGTRPDYAGGFDLNSTIGRLEAIKQSQKQNCLVLDFGTNSKRIGPINDPKIPNKRKKGNGGAPVKICDKCNTYNHAKVKYCDFCGNEFIFEIKIKETASTEDIIKDDTPVVEEFEVDRIVYAKHYKINKPSSLRVTYYCGMFTRFQEFVCIEHEGGARNKAKKWWKERTTLPLPNTIDEALAIVTKLKTCTGIRVWTNKVYPEILAYCFDGSNFGKQESDPFKIPEIETEGATQVFDSNDYLDDDIPF